MDSNHHVPARGYRTNSDLYEMPSERTNRKYTSWTQISNSVGEKVRKVKGKSPSIEPGPQEDYRPQSKQDNPVELEAQDPVHTYSRSFGPLPDPSFRQNSLQHSGMERGDLPAYVYHPATKGLVKRVSSPHMVPYRDQNSFGSTKAQADMPWERNHGRSGGGSPTFGLQRRPVAGLQHSEEKEAIALHKSEDQENSYEEPVQFTRVKLAIANAQLQFPELKGSGGETTEATIQRFIKEYTRQSSQLKDTSSRPRRSSRSRSKIRKLETENHELLNEVRGVKSKLHDRELDYRALIKKHNEEMEKLNEQVTSLKKDKKDAEASYSKHKRILADENDRLKSFNEANLRSLKADVKNLKSLNENQDKDIIQLNKSYIREAELRINFERKAGNLVQELGMAQSDKDRAIHENDVRWQGELNAQKSSYDNVIHSLKTEARQLQNARDKEREERKKELRQQEKELEERFEQESKGYQTVIEQFRTDVLKRDHFKGYTDSEMSSLFKKLANGIEDFRLDWDSRKQSEWPYTEVQLHELHPKNTRKLKQHIIQNTLWLLLWEHIFRSPFRIFGSLGREQDLHWNDIYAAGQSPHEWPDVAGDVERDRYETAKAFLDTIESSTNEGGCKDSFEESIANAVSAMTRELEKVASLKIREEKSLESIVRLAAKTWLESCSQRYRLVVITTHGSGDILSYGTPQPSGLKLIIRPDLKRYGDSQGKDLMRGEPLAGWKGSVESYPQ